MANWNSSPHPISDLREWYLNKRIIIQPDFQRKTVWSQSAKVMLMDTILTNIPMPKIFLSTEIVDKATIRTVIDGQQRINAILGFLNDEFPLIAPYPGIHKELRFSALPKNVQDEFLAYIIDYNEVKAMSQQEIREIYSRVNKYSFPLNQQELRKADYPGKFLDLAEKLCVHSFLETIKIFTVANRRRLGDVEYVSELLAAMIDGAQEKKETLDDFYIAGATWTDKEYHSHLYTFESILEEIKLLNSKFSIANSRFKQKSDFYALFLAIHDLKKLGGTLRNKKLDFLVEDIRFLDKTITPDSPCEALQEYALKCISQANSKASREWRSKFLIVILSGTFLNCPPKNTNLLSSLKEIHNLECGDSRIPVNSCVICGNEFSESDLFKNVDICWENGTKEFQLENAGWAHRHCRQRGKHGNF